jgi:hypothetical protein
MGFPRASLAASARDSLKVGWGKGVLSSSSSVASIWMATTALAYHFSCSCSNDVHTEHLSRGFFSHHLYKPLIFREDHAKGVHAEWGSTDYDIKALLFLPLSGSNPRRRPPAG